METKIETTNNGEKVLADDGERIVGPLNFTFNGNALSINHIAFKEGIGAMLVSALNDYATTHI